MKTSCSLQRKSGLEAGHTLVELVVVVIIIGILITSVLKGVELVDNAQATATVAQISKINAATIYFEKTFLALPGDIRNPGARLAGCGAAPCNVAGNGNHILDGGCPIVPPQTTCAPIVTPETSEIGTEAAQFFVHLAAAGLIEGIDPAAGNVFGGIEPWSKITGCGIRTSTLPSGLNPGQLNLAISVLDNARLQTGLYLTIVGGVPGAGIGCMSAATALRIDKKLDDGIPNLGSIRTGANGAAAAGCGIMLPGPPNSGVPGTYNTGVEAKACYLHVHLNKGNVR